MNLKRELLVAAVSMLAVSMASSTGFTQPSGPENKEVNVQTGYLSCHVSSGFGIVVGSSRELNCVYTPRNGQPENYRGEITKFGADIGYLASGVILWTVVAPSSAAPNRVGLLAGHYAGATAGATLGLGAGINALLGGMHDTIALQPISIEGNQGLNVAGGIATMNLVRVPDKSTSNGD